MLLLISPFLQELIVYAGHLECYEQSHNILKKFTDVEMGDSQIFRITTTYGKELIERREVQRILPPVGSDDILYSEIDGGMILTREKKAAAAKLAKQPEDKAATDGKWREVKLCRMFRASDCLHPEGKRGIIRHSQYFGSLGDLDDFKEPVMDIIDSYGSLKNRLVFITDGATWIRRMIADNYPAALSILDYYHAAEHLHDFANTVFKDSHQKILWCKTQEQLLLQSEAEQVITNIKQITGSENEAATELIQYYTNNLSRMDYKAYRQIGCGIIGSGAIESAHRTVVQKRMKQSGQRWSIKGAQAMLELRVTACNDQWNKIVDLIRTPFKAAA